MIWLMFPAASCFAVMLRTFIRKAFRSGNLLFHVRLPLLMLFAGILSFLTAIGPRAPGLFPEPPLHRMIPRSIFSARILSTLSSMRSTVISPESTARKIAAAAESAL